MRAVRSVAGAAMALALVAGAPALARPTCPWLADPLGDAYDVPPVPVLGTQASPATPDLDLVGVDVSADRRSLTLTLHLDDLGTEPVGPTTGRYYGAMFTVDDVQLGLAASLDHTQTTGTVIWYKAPVVLVQDAESLGAARVVVDPVKDVVRITTDLATFAPATTVTAGDVLTLTEAFAGHQYGVRTPLDTPAGKRDTGTWGTPTDWTVEHPTYVLGATSCRI